MLVREGRKIRIVRDRKDELFGFGGFDEKKLASDIWIKAKSTIDSLLRGIRDNLFKSKVRFTSPRKTDPKFLTQTLDLGDAKLALSTNATNNSLLLSLESPTGRTIDTVKIGYADKNGEVKGWKEKFIDGAKKLLLKAARYFNK